MKKVTVLAWLLAAALPMAAQEEARPFEVVQRIAIGVELDQTTGEVNREALETMIGEALAANGLEVVQDGADAMFTLALAQTGADVAVPVVYGLATLMMMVFPTSADAEAGRRAPAAVWLDVEAEAGSPGALEETLQVVARKAVTAFLFARLEGREDVDG